MHILPSKFVGSYRYVCRDMHEIILTSTKLDTQPIFHHDVQPSTGKVQNGLVLRQNVINRPDIAALMHSIKLRALIAFLTDEKIFGQMRSHFFFIKVQKRCLLLPRCIIFLTTNFKTFSLQPTFVDMMTSAEIPSNESQSLGVVVHKHNMHGHCSRFNRSPVCTND